MSTLEQTLKAEIARIARREVKKALAPVQEAVRKQRQQIAALKQALQARSAQARAAAPAVPGVTADDVKKARFSGGLIHKIRARLGMSRQEFAQLVGVSPFSIIGWEHDEFRPKPDKRQALIALRKISPRAARQLLAAKKTIADA